MLIHFHPFPILSVLDNAWSTIAGSEQKIILIAVAALALLAICYLIYQFSLKSRWLTQKKILDDGTIAEGAFKNDLLHGKGKKTYPNGRVDRGEFYQGVMSGQGKRTIPNLREEEGEFKDDQLHKGKITFADGKTIEGVFIDGALIQSFKQ